MPLEQGWSGKDLIANTEGLDIALNEFFGLDKREQTIIFQKSTGGFKSKFIAAAGSSFSNTTPRYQLTQLMR
jgi:hypothetical protein